MEDKRCCGSGNCIINAEGVCWCGQQWDGEKMVSPHTETNDTMENEKANHILTAQTRHSFLQTSESYCYLKHAYLSVYRYSKTYNH